MIWWDSLIGLLIKVVLNLESSIKPMKDSRKILDSSDMVFICGFNVAWG